MGDTKVYTNIMPCANIIGSRLDYCNAIFHCVWKNFVQNQRVQNRVAQIVCAVSRRQQSELRLCHRLSVQSRTDFKSRLTGQTVYRTESHHSVRRH